MTYHFVSLQKKMSMVEYRQYRRCFIIDENFSKNFCEMSYLAENLDEIEELFDSSEDGFNFAKSQNTITNYTEVI